MQKTTLLKKWKVIILFLIFLGPFALAWWVYHNNDNFDFEMTNKGQLLTDPPNIRQLPIYQASEPSAPGDLSTGQWHLVYISPTRCGPLCEENLYTMRQVQLAVGKDQDRVERVLLTYQDNDNAHLRRLLSEDYSGTLLYWVDPAELAVFLNRLPSKQIALQQGYLYIVDPHGNVIMGYAPDVAGRYVLKDMQKLLRLSTIG